MMEFQITLEYLGQGTHLTYLAPLFEECLDSETGVKDKNATVASAVDGSLFNNKLNAIAGVANIGNDINWTGHLFGQANWYAYGRMAWDHSIASEVIADEWIRMTLSNNKAVVGPTKTMMMRSREIVVQYMTPLGLHHIMGYNHHYGPAPWIKDKPRADWTSVYYHQAEANGIGFNRTATGSNALEQYAPSVRKIYEQAETCPEKYLLWFHHLPWDYKMKSGRTLWDELCNTYHAGADSVGWMKQQWQQCKGKIDDERWSHVNSLLDVQHQEAKWWRDACTLYFQSFSKKKFPDGLEKPQRDLPYYENLEFPYAPGIRPRW
jgi:alpha-glucuronidase